MHAKKNLECMKCVLNFFKLISNRQLKILLLNKKWQIIENVLLHNLNHIKEVSFLHLKIINNENGWIQ